MQPSLFTLAHHDSVRPGRVARRRELRPTVRQLVPLGTPASARLARG